MRRVRCINARNYNITEGQIYDVITIENNRVTILNDNGSRVTYGVNLFEDAGNAAATQRTGRRVQEVTEAPARPAAAPTPPPRRAWSERDMINSIQGNVTENGGNITLTVSYDRREFADSAPRRVESRRTLSLSGSNISCGVHQLSGISFIRFGNDFINYQNDDYEDLTNAVIGRFGTELNRNLRAKSTRFVIASDIQQRDHSAAFMEAAGFTNSTGFHRNPNSGNNIAIFILNTNR